jgi:hypothetical protein
MSTRKNLSKPVPLSGDGWLVIKAYGMLLGMTEQEMASHLLRHAVCDLLDSGTLARTQDSMELAKQIVRRKE